MAAITIVDGPLYQWDSGRKVRIILDLNEDIELVHYSSGNVVETQPDGDNVIAPIPNILLQTAKPLTVYAVTTTGGGVRTVTSRRIPVEAKEKPDDYVYAETEVRTWEDLDARLRAIEEGGVQSGIQTINGIGPDETGNIIIGVVSDVECAELISKIQ